jgi:antitoxin VapB
MYKAKLSFSGNHQIVELPQEIHMEGQAVHLKKINNAVLLIPIDNPWQPLLESIDKFSADFMENRSQPKNIKSQS